MELHAPVFSPLCEFVEVFLEVFCIILRCYNWRSLEDRRRDTRLTMLYKIDRELVAISKTDRLDRPTRRL
jgi:hypothetical protein